MEPTGFAVSQILFLFPRPSSRHAHLRPRSLRTLRRAVRQMGETRPTVSLPTERSGSLSASHPMRRFSGESRAILVYLSRRSPKLTNSPLTANIYFPAIPVMSRDFHKSIELINLTVTMYMVMQGICVSLSQHLRAVLTARYWLDDVAPMIWGTLSDRWGRRPMMFACLATLSLSCVGLALVPTSAYWLLLLLRCLQAAGSASTVALGMYLVRQASWFGMLMMALGSGIIADVATPAERGGFFGAFGLGPMVCTLSTCFEKSLDLGSRLVLPLDPSSEEGSPRAWVGGTTNFSAGDHALMVLRRAIFWFLCIGSATCGLGLFL